jgi:hypothetical protein
VRGFEEIITTRQRGVNQFLSNDNSRAGKSYPAVLPDPLIFTGRFTPPKI